jgi:hypothetical protein
MVRSSTSLLPITRGDQEGEPARDGEQASTAPPHNARVMPRPCLGCDLMLVQRPTYLT